MLGLLQDILCAILALPVLIIDLLVGAVNLLFAAIGALIAAILWLLPDMPTAPALPDGKFLDAINWVLPLVPMLAFFAICLGVFLSFLAFRIILNWLKVL